MFSLWFNLGYGTGLCMWIKGGDPFKYFKLILVLFAVGFQARVAGAAPHSNAGAGCEVLKPAQVAPYRGSQQRAFRSIFEISPAIPNVPLLQELRQFLTAVDAQIENEVQLYKGNAIDFYQKSAHKIFQNLNLHDPIQQSTLLQFVTDYGSFISITPTEYDPKSAQRLLLWIAVIEKTFEGIEENRDLQIMPSSPAESGSVRSILNRWISQAFYALITDTPGYISADFLSFLRAVKVTNSSGLLVSILSIPSLQERRQLLHSFLQLWQKNALPLQKDNALLFLNALLSVRDVELKIQNSEKEIEGIHERFQDTVILLLGVILKTNAKRELLDFYVLLLEKLASTESSFSVALICFRQMIDVKDLEQFRWPLVVTMSRIWAKRLEAVSESKQITVAAQLKAWMTGVLKKTGFYQAEVLERFAFESRSAKELQGEFRTLNEFYRLLREGVTVDPSVARVMMQTLRTVARRSKQPAEMLKSARNAIDQVATDPEVDQVKDWLEQEMVARWIYLNVNSIK